MISTRRRRQAAPLALAVLALLIHAAATSGSQDPPGPFRAQPQPLDPRSEGVGRLASDFSFTDVDGKAGRLSEYRGRTGIVLAMQDLGCPVSRRYGPRWSDLEQQYTPRGLAFLYINVNPQDSPERIRREMTRLGLKGRAVADPEARLAALLRPKTTTEVFVLDGALTLLYRGAVDDQYGLGYSRAEPREHYLVAALQGLIDGRPVLAATSAPGCALRLPAASRPATAITYHNRVSRILQSNCQTCHRAGGTGPFALESYPAARGFGAMIRQVVEQEIMPPWFADPGVGAWDNDRRLAPEDRRDLLAWLVGDMPEGDAADAPLPRRWETEWQIGTPEAVLQIPEPIAVPAEGVVDYRYAYVKTDFPEDRWIQKMEVRPTAPQVTHHVLVFIEEPGRKTGRDRKPDDPPFQGGLRGYFASTVPGQQPTVYPAGTAKRLPRGAWLKFQLHYTPNGQAAADRTRLGLVFAPAPPQRVLETGAATNVRFAIPPGDPNHAVSGEYTFRTDATLVSFFPHMHLRSKAFLYELVHPDGRSEELLRVSRYDFNWQLIYLLKQPRFVAAGGKLRATGWYDNSAANPANPDPTQTVRFGEQTYDEMMIGYFDWYRGGAP